MIRINCPFCGERDHTEFSYGSDAAIVYPELDAPVDAWHDAVLNEDLMKTVCAATNLFPKRN